MAARAERQASHYGETGWSVAGQALTLAGAAYSYATLPDKLFTVRSGTFTQMHWIGPAFLSVFFFLTLAVLPPSRFSPLIDRITMRRYTRAAAGAIIWAATTVQLWVISLLIHFIVQGRILNTGGTQLIHTAA